MQIRAVTDNSEARTWAQVVRMVEHYDRPQPWPTSVAEVASLLGHPPTKYVERHWLCAEIDNTMVGVAHISMSINDNQHLADLQISVLPAYRRRGIATALHAAAAEILTRCHRTTVIGEVYQPTGLSADDVAGVQFARSLGYRVAHTEDHLVLDLADSPAGGGLQAIPAGYEVVGWRDRCPDEYLDAYVAMRNQMNRDVPTGELDYEPVVVDEARLRATEDRLRATWRPIVAAVRASDGSMAGYSTLLAPIDLRDALQDDTLVMPAHRGHGLGALMKRATLARLQVAHPEIARIHTWTDPDNTAMQRINREFGYRDAEVLYEMELRT